MSDLRHRSTVLANWHMEQVHKHVQELHTHLSALVGGVGHYDVSDMRRDVLQDDYSVLGGLLSDAGTILRSAEKATKARAA